MVGERDARLMGWTSHFRSVRGLEKHVRHMGVREGETEVAYT